MTDLDVELPDLEEEGADALVVLSLVQKQKLDVWPGQQGKAAGKRPRTRGRDEGGDRPLVELVDGLEIPTPFML